MRVDQELPQQPPETSTVLSIGVFDGVHRGHRELLRTLQQRAYDGGMLSGVITFKNHPRTVVAPDTSVTYITSVEERLRLLKLSGVDMVIPLTFDIGLSRLQAHEFTSLLKDKLNMKSLVIGYNFAMGYRRQGTPERLTEIGHEQGFSVNIIDAITTDDERISSTIIRETLSAGNVDKASKLLGRHFSFDGQVIHGDARGKALGFPTANLAITKDRLVPGNGIYVCWVTVDDKRYMAATNIGTRPTFGDNERIIETFILDFDADIYGNSIKIEFIQRLRDELPFQTTQALIDQMNIDVSDTRKILGS